MGASTWTGFGPDPYEIPLERLDPSNPLLFKHDVALAYFERLRREDPVHRVSQHECGPYWAVTRYEDIVRVDTDHETFSSRPAVTIDDANPDFPLPMFIAMDPPRHDAQRRAVAAAGWSASLARLEPVIRRNAAEVLDRLPVGQPFDWVSEVSMELTVATLAALFDMPQADRRLLARWSDVATARTDSGLIASEAERRRELEGCAVYFEALWTERAAALPREDLISMLAHGEATRSMDRREMLGALLVLIVGGNDTSRNTLSASVLALSQHSELFARLGAEPALIPAMISETLRWQSPIAHMRRVARRDVELNGKRIRRGDKVVMWYVSGNHDEAVFDRPDDFVIERPNVRRHLSFGFGIHRCLGARVAELQLRVIWEEILKRFSSVRLVEDAERTHSNFIRGFTCMTTEAFA